MPAGCMHDWRACACMARKGSRQPLQHRKKRGNHSTQLLHLLHAAPSTCNPMPPALPDMRMRRPPPPPPSLLAAASHG